MQTNFKAITVLVFAAAHNNGELFNLQITVDADLLKVDGLQYGDDSKMLETAQLEFVDHVIEDGVCIDDPADVWEEYECKIVGMFLGHATCVTSFENTPAASFDFLMAKHKRRHELRHFRPTTKEKAWQLENGFGETIGWIHERYETVNGREVRGWLYGVTMKGHKDADTEHRFTAEPLDVAKHKLIEWTNEA